MVIICFCIVRTGAWQCRTAMERDKGRGFERPIISMTTHLEKIGASNRSVEAELNTSLIPGVVQ